MSPGGDTEPVPAKDIDGVRAALRDNQLTELIGLAECLWLDVKEGVYQLEDPAGAEELVKDAAAFANAPFGGLLLVGFRTVREHGEEIIAELRPVPRATGHGPVSQADPRAGHATPARAGRRLDRLWRRQGRPDHRCSRRSHRPACRM